MMPAYARTRTRNSNRQNSVAAEIDIIRGAHDIDTACFWYRKTYFRVHIPKVSDTSVLDLVIDKVRNLIQDRWGGGGERG